MNQAQLNSSDVLSVNSNSEVAINAGPELPRGGNRNHCMARHKLNGKIYLMGGDDDETGYSE